MCHHRAKGQAIDPKASDAHQGPWCHCVVYTNILPQQEGTPTPQQRCHSSKSLGAQ
ncbi:hypothetical protein I79_007767 [Cricetulus griseus]|uniref:Uncharacterized protein n=1 Tax=Cricetulus griseus TaxID=10029 RepID=G3HBD9_CRIGR|nr:hypothetical protein I79_007767 [Cricetulus griseus]